MYTFYVRKRNYLSTFIVSFLFLNSIAVFSQEQLSAPSPSVSVPNPNYDFGRVRSGERVKHVYEVKNVGDGVLTISKPKTSCGCTTALLDKPDVPPGGSARIQANFSTKGRVGNQTKVITFKTNDRTQPKVELRLTGKVQPVLTTNPPFVYFSGGKSNLELKHLNVSNFTNPQFALKAVSSSSPYIQISPDKELGSEGPSQRVTIQLKEGAPRGKIFEKVALFTNDPLQPIIWIPVWGRN